MPRKCPGCHQLIEPIAIPYTIAESEHETELAGYFMTCPDCRWVFSRLGTAWFGDRDTLSDHR